MDEGCDCFGGYVVAVGAIANILAWLTRKAIIALGKNEKGILYACKQRWILYRLLLTDIIVLVLVPCVVFSKVDLKLLWGQGSLVEVEVSCLGFHLAAGIITKFLSLCSPCDKG